MYFILHPWHVVLLALSALVNHERDNALEYLVVENQVLREKLGKDRVLLNDDHRGLIEIRFPLVKEQCLAVDLMCSAE